MKRKITLLAFAARCGNVAAEAFCSPIKPANATAPKPQPAVCRNSRRVLGRSNRLQLIFLVKVKELVRVQQDLAEVIHGLMERIIRFDGFGI